MTQTPESAADRWSHICIHLIRNDANRDYFMEHAAEDVGDDDSEEFYERCCELALG